MNLRGLVNSYTQQVNPNIVAQYLQSTGYTTSSSGKRTPSFAPAVPVTVQMQALTYKDLQQMSGVNLNGEARAIYVSGDWKGVARPDMRGGDLFALPDGSSWLVVHVLENWNTTAGWTKVAATRQMLTPVTNSLDYSTAANSEYAAVPSIGGM